MPSVSAGVLPSHLAQQPQLLLNPAQRRMAFGSVLTGGAGLTDGAINSDET